MMAVGEEEHAKESTVSHIFWKVWIALAFCIAWYSRAGIYPCLNWIKGILCKCSVYKWLIKWNCFNGGRDGNQMGYYDHLLEDLNCIEPGYQNLIPSLKNKIRMLKLQVRYILPYVSSRVVTVDKRYDKVKMRLRSRVSAEVLDEFVAHVLEQTLLVKADATYFYCCASVSEYDCRKCSDCVLDNLKYVQSLEMNVPFAVKELVKHISERLRFLIAFRMLVEKRNFMEVCTETKLTEIYKKTDSLIRETAYLFRSFTVKSIDAREAKAIDLEFSELYQKANDCRLQAKSVYFGIMEVLGLTLPDACPVKSETLCGFIVSLQKNLQEISKYHFSFIDSKEHDIEELLMEMDFLKSLLMHTREEFVEHGKLNAILTHIDSLAYEAESIVYSFVTEFENQDNDEAMLKVKDVAERAKLARLQVREINSKDVRPVYFSVGEFLKCFRTLLTEDIWFELGFLRTLLRCTGRWSIDHPLLDTIKLNTENVICKSWWELRRFKFRKFRSENGDEELKSIQSCLLKNITVNNAAITEVCIKIKALEPSTPSSPMSETLGLEFADSLSSKLHNLQCCNPDSFSEMGCQLDEAISFLGLLHEITAMLCVDDKGRNDLLIYLEDLTERAACLSYIHLMSGVDETVSFNQLLLHNEDPELGKIFVRFIDVPIWGLTDFKQRKDDVMLQVIRFLISNLMQLINSESIGVDFTEKQVNSLESGLNILRCILTDPLLLYYEQEELDDILKEIGTGICELGTVFCYLSAKICREGIHCSLVENVDCFKGSVSRAYMKFCKLTSSKLPISELGFLESLLANLMKLKDGKVDYAPSTMHQIEALHNELIICNTFLEDNPFKDDDHEKSKGLKNLILNVARKVEYVIDTFEDLPEWYFRMRLADVTEELQSIKEETTKTKSFQILIEKPEVPVTMKEAAKPGKAKDGEVIGFEDEEEKLIKRLCAGARTLEINSIVGMPGSGKTTLAMKVYEGIASSFTTHAWCYVSQNYEKKVLLQHILHQIIGPSSNLDELSTEDLALKLYQCLLKTKNYLIVLDDIWDIEAWNSLKSCFPPSNNGGTILLTSRFIPIGAQLSGDGACLELQPLLLEKSWHLLEKKVFGERSCPQHLHEVGKKISKKCAGLPLSIVVIAGVLQNIEENEGKWREVEEGLDSLVKNQDGILDKLELSYNHLTVRLKQCFLYCGAFLRGKEIPRSRLARLWAAERFIEETDHQQRSVDDAAECCLRDLVDRSLLIVTKTGSSNQIQNCRMHDLLRDFCIRKGEEETFLHIVHRWDSLPSWHRRLCFRRPILFNNFRDTLAHTAPTRTLMFNPYLVEIASIIIVVYDISNFEKFKLLTVLDMECVDMGDTLPESITRLILLRYWAVRGRMEHIPPSIGELVNLETLIFKETTGKLIHVPETIFDLRKLRHLLVHDQASVVNNENSDSLDCLQSLATPALCNCDICDATIARLPNLRKLRCIFRECWDESINVFPDLSSLRHLETLKVIYSGEPQYPCQFSFPSTLKKLTLSKFQLPWSEMETIAVLPQLETLKLKDNCFRGQKWVTDMEFSNLKYMSLEELDIEEWETSEDCFPCLERLVVRNCTELKAIPSDFSQVETLVSIEVNWCNLTVAESVEEIAKDQRNSGNAQFKTKTSCIGLDSSDVASDSPDHPRFEPEVYKQFIDVCRDPFGVASNMGA